MAAKRDQKMKAWMQIFVAKRYDPGAHGSPVVDRAE
jgi:hypothetical protein